MEAQKPQEKQPEIPFLKFSFGQFLGEADKAKKDPELPKKVAVKKPVDKSKNPEVPEESELKRMANNLAHTAKKVEVKTDPKDTAKNTVKINLDLAKFKDLPNGQLTDVLTPDVKACNLKIYETDAKGARQVKDERVVFRGMEDGKINYFFKDKSGKNVPVSLPLNGEAELTINPDQLKHKSRAEVLDLMKEELVRTSKKALGRHVDDLAGSLVVAPKGKRAGGRVAETSAYNPGGRDAVEGSSEKAPAYNGETLRSGDRILKYPISPKAIAIIKSFSPNDKFVGFRDAYSGRNVNLRETTYQCLELARQFAQADGYDITVNSGYRNVSSQKAAFGRSDRSGKMVAAPGKSWHHSGAAADCFLVKKDDPSGRRINTADGKARLESYMNKAGFVRYKVEYWHFEVGSPDWTRIMAQAGALSSEYADRGQHYDRLQV
ncbi:D-alanyl-D-alanine carboxypeptidase family protein [Candidatus Peregrinibacteria bacterium]|nr:D-alanyl-D-alanine carboxypeptidase family protein [Candidatus Peregrinibacteria bacterium]